MALAAGLALMLSMVLASAASSVAEPSITSHPAELTNETSASFTYSDSQAGVGFQCALDSGGFSPCSSSGITYAGLDEGSHTFKVRAVSGTKTGPATTFKWRIDTTPPEVTLTFPVEGGIYSASNWRCSAGVGFCGKAKDGNGVASVAISVRQGNGDWWGGTSFNQTSETFNAAAVESPGSNNTGWSYAFSLPPAGAYTVHVRAEDEAGNTTPAASQASATFTIKTAAPPAPTITSGPDHETASQSATFSFEDSQAGVSFLCAKDKSKFIPCTSPTTYGHVSKGQHTFYVEPSDAAGNVGAASSYTWSVVKGFEITGDVTGLLLPGISQPLHLTITNPNSKAMLLTNVTVSVEPGSTKAGCDGPTNLQISQSNASESNTVTVPAKGGKVTLPSGTVTAPQVLMKDLPTNQDACQGASFTLHYSGSGHS